MRHEMGRWIYGPATVVVRCSCDWSHTERRRQNALGRSSKMGRAIREHFRVTEHVVLMAERGRVVMATIPAVYTDDEAW